MFTVTANGQKGHGGHFTGVYEGASVLRALLAAWKACHGYRRGASIVRIEWRK